MILAPVLAFAADDDASDWRISKPGWDYEFPRDEFSHPDFKTEWWYFTGNLATTSDGRRFGYQLTFFRQGVRSPAERAQVQTTSKFVTDHIWFAHFAISDLDRNQFRATERFSRGSFDEAGSGPAAAEEKIVWLKDWSLRKSAETPGHYQLRARADDFALELTLDTEKPPVFHGAGGLSPKSADPGNASHYFSFTRLKSRGVIELDGRKFDVSGSSWYDREWSTSALSRDQAGWDWFSIQLDNGAELMLFQLRQPDGTPNFTSGTLVASDGSSESLKAAEISLKPLETWQAPGSKVDYPIAWQAAIPSRAIDLRIRAAQPDQLLKLAALTYWEGATTVEGTADGKPVAGCGYLELTGYDGKMTALSQ